MPAHFPPGFIEHVEHLTKQNVFDLVGEVVDVTCTEHNHPPDQA